MVARTEPKGTYVGNFESNISSHWAQCEVYAHSLLIRDWKAAYGQLDVQRRRKRLVSETRLGAEYATGRSVMGLCSVHRVQATLTRPLKTAGRS